MADLPDVAPAFRALVVVLLAAPVVLVLAMVPVLPLADATPPPPLVVAGLLLLVALVAAAAEAVGFTTPPMSPRPEPDPAAALREAMDAHRLLTLTRWALAESPVVIAVGLAFVLTEHGLWTPLVVLVPSLAVMALEVWPSRRVVRRTAAALEADGARSFLPEAFGHA